MSFTLIVFLIACYLMYAHKMGTNGFTFGLLLLFLSFIMFVAKLIYAAATTEEEIKCPSCAETVKKDAKVCRFCGTKIS